MMTKDQLIQYNNAALQRVIASIKSLPPDSPVVKANQKLLGATSGPTWLGGGDLALAGAYWWGLSCLFLLDSPTAGCRGVSFDAKGHGLTLGLFDCLVAGAFVVDPSTIGGSCEFALAVGAVGEGMVSINLTGTDPGYTVYGSFTGEATGLGGGGITGSGELTVVG